MKQVSVIIAFRNEQENIPTLLASIDQLTFPKNEVEFLFGNDGSEDSTADLLSAYAARHANVRLINLEKPGKNEILRGKVRVLERLCKEAKGKYFLFTDADIELPAGWIEGLLNHFSTTETGVVVGVTGMRITSLKAAMQSMEWLTVLYFLYLFGKMGIKGTGMGNNMAVSKEAYWSTGGYKEIPFSIVEDYALYKAVLQAGYKFKQAFEKEVLAYTKPPGKFFEQRKRWLKGGFESGSALIIPGLVQTLWIPFLVVIGFILPSALLYLVAAPFVVLMLTTWLWQRQLHLKGFLKYVPIFGVYLPVTWLLTQLYYFLPGGIKWKNRIYE